MVGADGAVRVGSSGAGSSGRGAACVPGGGEVTVPGADAEDEGLVSREESAVMKWSPWRGGG
ncbi:hypothetical protein GCM10018952_22500 [Streptosporangium vulgare]